jgi:amino acid transporter
MLRWFQIIVTSFKSIPILFVLLATLFFSRSNSSSFALVGQGSGAWLVDGLPIVIFAFLGIECICALAHMIEQGEKNASRAIFLSFFVVTVLYAVLQYGLIAVLGKAASSPDAFARVPLLFFSSPVLIKISQLFVSLGIVVSYLGGAYGSFYANNWILYAMAHDIVAQEGKPRSPLVRLNEFGEPAVPIFLQAVIMIGMLLFFNHWALVSISDLGVVFSYAIVALAFVFWFFTKRHFMRVFIGVAGVLSCFVMLFYVWQGWAHVLLSLLAFTVTSVIYFVIAKKSKKSA